jgi:hypothetical protein
MSERSSWTGSAADLLRFSVKRSGQTSDRIGWPKNPRALAGHLRRAQTFLRTFGIDITFSREGLIRDESALAVVWVKLVGVSPRGGRRCGRIEQLVEAFGVIQFHA